MTTRQHDKLPYNGQGARESLRHVAGHPQHSSHPRSGVQCFNGSVGLVNQILLWSELLTTTNLSEMLSWSVKGADDTLLSSACNPIRHPVHASTSCCHQVLLILRWSAPRLLGLKQHTQQAAPIMMKMLNLLACVYTHSQWRSDDIC